MQTKRKKYLNFVDIAEGAASWENRVTLSQGPREVKERTHARNLAKISKTAEKQQDTDSKPSAYFRQSYKRESAQDT